MAEWNVYSKPGTLKTFRLHYGCFPGIFSGRFRWKTFLWNTYDGLLQKLHAHERERVRGLQ